MRVASRVLGIIGACLGLLWGGIFLLFGAVFNSAPFDSGGGFFFDEGYSAVSAASPADDPALFGAVVFTAMGAAVVLASAMGIAGSVLVKRRHTASGVLFIIAAVLTLVPGFLISVLFLLAGIFALVREKPQPMYAPYPPPYPYAPVYPYAPPYPYPPAVYAAYPPYPPQGAYPPPAAPAPTADQKREES